MENLDITKENLVIAKENLDIAAYTTSYHMNGGCALEKDAFWGTVM